MSATQFKVAQQNKRIYVDPAIYIDVDKVKQR